MNRRKTKRPRRVWVSCAELARMTGKTEAEAAEIVRGMVAKNALFESPEGLLAINPDHETWKAGRRSE